MSHSAQRTQEASSAQRDVTIWRCGATSGDKRRSVLLCEGVAGDAAELIQGEPELGPEHRSFKSRASVARQPEIGSERAKQSVAGTRSSDAEK